MIEFLRNVLLTKTAPEIIKNDITIYQEIANQLSISEITKVIYQFNDCIQKMKNSNYPKLILELCVIQNTVNETTDSKSLKKEEVIEKKDENYFPGNITEVKKEEKKPEAVKKEKKESVIKYTNEQREKMDKLKMIRVNNTLSKFNKKQLLHFRNTIQDEMRTYLLNPDYSHIVSLLMDGMLKAASDEYLIVVFDELKMSDLFNQNLSKVEQVISDAYHQPYKIISLSSQEWEPIKNDFNHKTRKFEYQEEQEKYVDFMNPTSDNETESKSEMEQLFGNIVEYN